MSQPESPPPPEIRGRTTPQPAEAQTAADHVQLKLLMVFHYVLGGVSIGSGLHVILVLAAWFFFAFLAFSFGAQGVSQGEGAVILGIAGVVFGAVTLLALSWIICGPVSLAAGRKLRDRRDYAFCRRWANIQMFTLFPLGIPLGICTRNVLRRQSVRSLFVGREYPA